jgi:hypothetical protein
MLAQPLARRLARPLARRIVRSGDFSPAAQDYFARVSSAGGTVTHPGPVSAYIDALVALGGAYWNTMGTHCIFAGVTFPGCFVPLRSGMDVPTNFNFVSGDHNTVTGLIGDGATKYISSGRNNNADGQNDFSMSIYIHTVASGGNGAYMGSSAANGSCAISRSGGFPNTLFVRSRTNVGDNTASGGAATGFIGTSRAIGGSHNVRYSGSVETVSRASQSPQNQIISVFHGNGAAFADGRLKAYHIGPAITQSVLEGLQDTLFAAIT